MSAEAMKLAQKWQQTNWNTESPMSADFAVSGANDVINALMDALREALAEQPAPATDTELINRGCHYQTELTQPAQQPAQQLAPVHPDSSRIDWLTNNPVDALNIFGHVKGADPVRWIRQEIDNTIKEKNT